MVNGGLLKKWQVHHPVPSPTGSPAWNMCKIASLSPASLENVQNFNFKGCVTSLKNSVQTH